MENFGIVWLFCFFGFLSTFLWELEFILVGNRLYKGWCCMYKSDGETIKVIWCYTILALVICGAFASVQLNLISWLVYAQLCQTYAGILEWSERNQQIFEWFGMSFMVHSERKKSADVLSGSNYLFPTSSLSWKPEWASHSFNLLYSSWMEFLESWHSTL